MNQTPPELHASYKAPLVAAARDLLRVAGTDGVAFEIPASVPPVKLTFMMLKQRPGLVSQPETATSGVRWPEAMFSPSRLQE